MEINPIIRSSVVELTPQRGITPEQEKTVQALIKKLQQANAILNDPNATLQEKQAAEAEKEWLLEGGGIYQTLLISKVPKGEIADLMAYIIEEGSKTPN